MLSLNLLGPFELRDGERVLPLRTRKSMALLLRLAIDGPQGRAPLVAMLWPEQDEPDGRRNLRRDLIRLRDAGAGDAVRADGDRLMLSPDVRTDLQRFAALQGQTDASAAMALWRGPLAQDLDLADAPDFNDWLSRERARVQRLWRKALHTAAKAAQSAGRLDQAVALVEQLLADDPLQEHDHRHLMQLLTAAGRREEALRQFERCRTLLADELSLQPMPQTLALVEALRQEVTPRAAHPTDLRLAQGRDPPTSPTATKLLPQGRSTAWLSELPLVGREPEVERMQQAWSQGRPMVVLAEAGLGKTRLATDFAASQGAYALVRCQAGDAELPFGAFARALRALAGQPLDLRALAPWMVAELARILPEAGPLPPSLPPLRDEGERLRLDEACLRAWVALAGDAFDAIVLDDWHLADDASRKLLVRIAARRRESKASGPVEIFAWRGGAEDVALQTFVAGVGAVVVTLEPLPMAAVQALVHQMSGAGEPVLFSQRLSHATGGNPFFIGETLRDLAARGLLSQGPQGRWQTPFDAVTTDYGELPLAASVRDAVLARVRLLDAATVRLLEAAALAAEPFGATLLASACALSEAEALQALEQAAQAQLVQADSSDGFVWVHDLSRQALAAGLAPTRRRLVHHRLALAATAAKDDAAAARHFQACGERKRAVPHRIAAGDAAHVLHALAEAAAHWQQGLACQPDGTAEVALLGRLCSIGWALGRAEEGQVHLERLQALLGSLELASEVRAQAQLGAVTHLMKTDKSEAAMALLQGMPVPESTATRHRYRTTQVGLLKGLGRMDEAQALCLQVLQAPGLGAHERAELTSLLSGIEMYRGHLAAGVEHAGAALRLFEMLQDGLGRARSLFHRGCCHAELGLFDRAADDLRNAAHQARDLGHVSLHRLASYNLASVYANQTLPQQALAVVEEAWPGLASDGQGEMALMFRTMVIECQHMCGRWGELWQHLGPAVDQALAVGAPLGMVGVANTALEPAAALGQWPRVAPLFQAIDAAGLFTTMPGAAEVLLAAAQAAVIRGDPGAARAWLERATAVADPDHARMQCRIHLLRAQLGAASGAGPDTTIPADDAPGMNAELRLRALALRLAAAPAGQAAALNGQAQAALADPRTHAGAALELARVLGPASLQAQVDQAAASLAGFPALQASLRDTWLPG